MGRGVGRPQPLKGSSRNILRVGMGTSVNYMIDRQYKRHLNTCRLNKGYYYWNKVGCPLGKDDVWKWLKGLVCLQYKVWVWIMPATTDHKIQKLQQSFCRLPRNQKRQSTNPSVTCCSIQCHKCTPLQWSLQLFSQQWTQSSLPVQTAGNSLLRSVLPACHLEALSFNNGIFVVCD